LVVGRFNDDPEQTTPTNDERLQTNDEQPPASD
jgi:hypothetical protein